MRSKLACVLLAAALAACGSSNSFSPAAMRGASALERGARAAAAVGTYRSLYLFKGASDGANPYAGLTAFKGAFYGVTYGSKEGACGFGSVFVTDSSGKTRAIYCFKGTPDGEKPVGALLALGDTLYGTTYGGGTHGFGSVFTIDAAGKERVIYSFQGGTDATNPGAGLIALGGELYGTTVQTGGPYSGFGTVYEVSTSGKEHVLHRFAGFPSDGEYPYAALVALNGELYGTTQGGGANRLGIAFAMSTAGKERILHPFGGPSDGAFPFGTLVALKGTLYGTTSGSAGTVFSLTTSGSENVVYTFAGGTSDGSSPRAALTAVNGLLYGTTEYGGASGAGTIFNVTTSGKETMLYSFSGAPKDGANPFGGLLEAGGVLYGTTLNGGIADGGTNHPDGGSLFSYKP